MGNNRDPLLHKREEEKYESFEDCPGCKVDLLKRSDRSVPVKAVFYISIVTLCAGQFSLSRIYDFFLFKFEGI